MNDTLKMYGSIGSEIMNRYFVVAMCFKSQPRWRRLQTTYSVYKILIFNANNMNLFVSLLRYSNILYNIQIFKMAVIVTTVLQETKPGDWAACEITNVLSA